MHAGRGVPETVIAHHAGACGLIGHAERKSCICAQEPGNWHCFGAFWALSKMLQKLGVRSQVECVALSAMAQYKRKQRGGISAHSSIIEIRHPVWAAVFSASGETGSSARATPVLNSYLP
jgi:hypothetical protein